MADTSIHKEERPVFLYDGAYYVRLHLEDIVYASSDRDQCELVMYDGTKHRLSYPLKHLVASLPENVFVRIHRQHIINIWHVERMSGSLIKMDNGIKLTLGKTYKEVLDNRFKIIAKCRN